MTKEMTAGRRTDLLSDALVHYAEHRVEQFGKLFKTLNFLSFYSALSNTVHSTNLSKYAFCQQEHRCPKNWKKPRISWLMPCHSWKKYFQN